MILNSVYLNKNNNININNINFEKIYLNDNMQNTNNISLERKNINNNYCEIDKIKNLDDMNNIKTILKKKLESKTKKFLKKHSILNLNKGNLTNELNNSLKYIYYNTLSLDTTNSNKNNKTRNKIKIIKKDYSNNKSKLSNNITYKSPLLKNNNIFMNTLNYSYNNHNFRKYKNIVINLNKKLNINEFVYIIGNNKNINNSNISFNNFNYSPNSFKINNISNIDINTI